MRRGLGDFGGADGENPNKSEFSRSERVPSGDATMTIARSADRTSRPTRRWTKPAVRCVASVLVGLTAIGPSLAVVGPSHVAAQPLEYLGDEFHLDVWKSPSRDLCIGEVATFTVVVSRWALYQTPQGKKLVPRRLPPRYKGLLSTDVNVRYDSAILREVVTVADTQVEYLAGTAIGTSAVTFTVDPPFGGTLTKTFNVRVRSCDYRAMTLSTWYLQADVTVLAVSTINTIIKAEPPNGRLMEIKNPMAKSHNVAAVIAVRGCPASETVSHFNSPVIGELNLDTGNFPVTINYGSVTAGTFATCLIISGNNARPDTGTPDPLTFDMTANGGTAEQNHVLHAPGLGDYDGVTHLWLTPIPK